MISKARVGENRPSVPTTAWPKYRLGSSAPIRPLAWVQSVGVQKISPFWGNQFCDATKPGRLPIRALWGSSTPFGASVASEPYSSKAGRDRKSVGEGQKVAVSVDPGGRCILRTNKSLQT